MTTEWILTVIGSTLGTLLITTAVKALVRRLGGGSRGFAGVLVAAAGAVICGVLLGLYPPAGQTDLYTRVFAGFAGATVIYKAIHEIVKTRSGPAL